MGEKIARGAAAVLAALLVLAYFLLPSETVSSYSTNGGRDKMTLEAGEEYSWTWTPQEEGTRSVDLRFSGVKKAEDRRIYAEIAGGEKTAASGEAAAADLKNDRIVLEGNFSKGTEYTLRIRTEGGGSLKLRGEEDAAAGFSPQVNEESSHTIYNPVLLFFAAGLLMLGAVPVKGSKETEISQPGLNRRWGERVLPLATFLLIAGLGIFITVAKPMFETGADWSSWDEETHWGHVTELNVLEEGGLQRAAARLNVLHPGYAPLVLGYHLGRIFTRTEMDLYHAAVGCSALIYALLCALAVKHAPRYKATFLAAGTMPTILFLMTSATYDTVIIGCMLLGTALTLEIMDQPGKMRPLQAMTVTAVMAFGTLAKPLYSPVLMLLLLIPNRSFSGKRAAWGFRAFVMVMFAWCVISVLLPGAYESTWTGDTRYGEVSTPGQLAAILADPFGVGLTPVRILWRDQAYYLRSGIAHWGYLGNNPLLNRLWLWLLLIVCPLCTAGEKRPGTALLTPWRRIFLGGIALGADLLFAYALYMTSSPVGGTELMGMQARYFIPVWSLMALALMWPEAIRKRMGKIGEWLTAPVFLFCLGANLWNAIYYLSETGMI